ncbi:laccase [Artomyces pyxidatus]|uniref:Laccase n=1 Tax=Artomyces pyxidatus TaxID=48021 RepID=A0ACB8STE5_9AGAM|nr:laccase [Artomyces pyxidatus]
MPQATSLVFVLASLASVAHSAVVSQDLHIVNQILSPDGYSRDTVLAGDTFPGPLISGNKGDNFQINVFDDLTDSALDLVTSIHWHGIDQKGTNEMDGVSMVTQCPIIPGDSFLYNFNIPDQAGTFWYHSHYGTQYCDGLRGPLVVYDPSDPQASLYDVDDATTILTLADWYHYLSPVGPIVAQPNSTLINGQGRYPGGPASTLAVVSVTQGKRYRMRMINIACDPNFMFSIDGHQLTIIEVDGSNVQPLLVDQIQIFAAQRYSFVLNANQPVDNYWIRALPNTPGASYTGGLNSAILRYAGAADTDPTSTLTTSTIPLVETNLHVRVCIAPGTPTPGAADINLNLAVSFVRVGTHFTVNQVTYESPPIPVLLQILNGTQDAASLLPTGSVIGLQPNKVVEIVIPGGAGGGPHPVHLHGHSFYVVRSAGNATYNWVDPVIRDVVSIGTTSADQTTIRFVTDNAGPWFLHCHIDWHLNEGFAVVFAEDAPDVAADNSIPTAWDDLCPAYNTFIGSSS